MVRSRSIHFLAALCAAASLFFAPRLSAECDVQRSGFYMADIAEQDFIVVTCWIVRYDELTKVQNSQGDPLTFADFPLNAEVVAVGCELEDFTLLAESITLVTAARACEDVFEGPHFGEIPENNWIFVSCWAVRWDENTLFVDSDENTIAFSDASFQGSELRATTCQGEEWPPYASKIEKVTSGASNLASTSDVQVAWQNDFAAGYYVSGTSDEAFGPTGIGSLNPTTTLRIGQRYMFSHPDPANYPFSIVARGAFPSEDVALLVHGFGVGPWEGDAGVNWVEDGADFFFTLTPELAEALGDDPGYRSQFHPASMRGQFSASGPSAVATWQAYE